MIPDKRYCFDTLRPLTSVGDVVDGHLNRLAFHPPGSVLDHYADRPQRGEGVIAWDRTNSAPLSLQFPDLEVGREAMRSAQLQEAYLDVHRWRFTPTSFRLLLRDLRELGFHDLTEVGGFETFGFEFFITLARTDDQPQVEDRLVMLERIESELRSVAGETSAGAPEDPELNLPEAGAHSAMPSPLDGWKDEEWDGYCSVCEQSVTFHAMGRGTGTSWCVPAADHSPVSAR